MKIKKRWKWTGVLGMAAMAALSASGCQGPGDDTSATGKQLENKEAMKETYQGGDPAKSAQRRDSGGPPAGAPPPGPAGAPK